MLFDIQIICQSLRTTDLITIDMIFTSFIEIESQMKLIRKNH